VTLKCYTPVGYRYVTINFYVALVFIR